MIARRYCTLPTRVIAIRGVSLTLNEKMPPTRTDQLLTIKLHTMWTSMVIDSVTSKIVPFMNKEQTVVYHHVCFTILWLKTFRLLVFKLFGDS